jgi:hypothetical protein
MVLLRLAGGLGPSLLRSDRYYKHFFAIAYKLTCKCLVAKNRLRHHGGTGLRFVQHIRTVTATCRRKAAFERQHFSFLERTAHIQRRRRHSLSDDMLSATSGASRT